MVKHVVDNVFAYADIVHGNGHHRMAGCIELQMLHTYIFTCFLQTDID